jgi:hypothetical protein
LKVLNSALLKKEVIDEIDKQRLDNEADNVCGQEPVTRMMRAAADYRDTGVSGKV